MGKKTESYGKVLSKNVHFHEYQAALSGRRILSHQYRSQVAYNRIMKYIPVSLIIGVTLLWCASPVRADDASKSEKAGELLQLIQSDQMMKMMEPMIKGMLAQSEKDMPAEQRAKAGELHEKIMALVVVSLNKAKPALAKAYPDTYTEEEIDGILAFYKSPAGKAYLQKMPEVMQRSMSAMMQMMGDLQPQMKTMMEGIKEKSK
jgi:hypothetical protein